MPPSIPYNILSDEVSINLAEGIKMKNKQFWLAITTALILITGQAFAAGQNSGFLEDYSGLQPDPDRPGAMRYIKPGVSLAKYTKIAFTPIEIWYDPNTEYKGISPDNMKLIADRMRSLIVKELEPDYPVVESAGPDVLAVRMAIANVKIKKKGRSLLNFTPVGFALYTVNDIAGANVNLDDAVIEAELLDSITGERLGILVDQQKKTASEGKASWQALEESLSFYAKRFRKRLDAER